MDNFNIPYDSLNLHISDKLTFCKEHGIDLLIEDSYETCRELADNGIKSILMTTKMNSDIEDKEIVRVNNWDEIYEEIEKYKKNREFRKCLRERNSKKVMEKHELVDINGKKTGKIFNTY